MNNWLIFAITLAATAGLLLATVAAGAYGKGPAYKPYWEDPNKRNAILAEASSVGILVQRGPQGVVVVGYRDQLNATYRTELLSVLSQLLKAAATHGWLGLGGEIGETGHWRSGSTGSTRGGCPT